MTKTITIFQLALAALALVFLVSGVLKFIKREKSQTIFKFFANIIIWGGIFIFALFPKTTHSLSEKLGFGDSLNTFIFIGFIIVFMIIFKIITMIERVERNISEMVRNETLSPLKNNHKND